MASSKLCFVTTTKTDNTGYLTSFIPPKLDSVDTDATFVKRNNENDAPNVVAVSTIKMDNSDGHVSAELKSGGECDNEPSNLTAFGIFGSPLQLPPAVTTSALTMDEIQALFHYQQQQQQSAISISSIANSGGASNGHFPSNDLMGYQSATNFPFQPAQPTLANFMQLIFLAKSFGFSIDFESRLITPYQSDAVSSSFAIPSSTVASSVIPNSFVLNEPKQKMLVQGKAFSKTVLQSASALHTNRRPICETTRRKIGSTLGRGSERCSNSINIQANDTKLSTQSSLSANNNHSPKVKSPNRPGTNFPLSLLFGNEKPKTLTNERMREYLAGREKFDCVLTIYNAKVAQKSYGNEKRFFCPPPCVHLKGEGWKLKENEMKTILRKLKDQSQDRDSLQCQYLTSDREIQNLVEMNACIGIGCGGSNSATAGLEKLLADKSTQQLDFPAGIKDYCSGKTLFISDTDKRKYFNLSVGLYYGSSLEIGIFSSPRIKVISKPSKKKQSMKTTDCKYLCITSGTKIALFNRLRSQTVSTRYLNIEGQNFHASANRWDAFSIILLERGEDGNFSRSESDVQSPIITYGSYVQLIHTDTGISIPPLMIRKVDKQYVLLDPSIQGEPVSQLHKCAFQMIDGNKIEPFYLCLSHERIIQAPGTPQEGLKHQISDGASWTIISTDKAEFRFFEGMGIARKPVAPIPTAHAIHPITSNETGINVDAEKRLEIVGNNFTSDLTVWFGAIPSTDTVLNGHDKLICTVPPLANVGHSQVPLMLVRDDGVIYPTEINYSYEIIGIPSVVTSQISHQETEQRVNHSGKITLGPMLNNHHQHQRFHPY